MEIALILYVIFATVALIWCSTPRTKPSVNYVRISRTMLSCLKKWNDNLVVVQVRSTGKRVAEGALDVPAEQLPQLLRWIPRRTTLVLCGANELTLCRRDIAMTLLSLDMKVVYVLEEDRHSSTAPTAPWMATPLL